jgi:nitroimidazol reductase NimA-like FMN-containing flavoprotein (pyridoxamine 5'-phosphate oxidase superfamily)
VTVRLAPGECWQLIAPGGVGRIAFTTSSGPVVLPVNFAVVADSLVIRTGQGTLIQAHAYDRVAFEVDHLDEAMHQGWSVLVSGRAHQVRQPSELGYLREAAAVWPWPGGEREAYVRIVPDRITGRRVEAQ